MMKTTLFGCSLMMLSCLTSDGWSQGQGGLQFMIGIPRGEFMDNINRNGYGIGAHIGYAPATLPFMIGLEAGYLNYGSESRSEPFSTTIPDVTVDVENSNNIVLAHAVFRLQPNQGMFRPYAGGEIGIQYLYTTTQIQNRGGGGEEVASSTNLSDVAFSYGGAAGMMVRVYEAPQDQGDGIHEVFVDLRFRYLSGGEAEYLKEGSIRRVNGRVEYDKLQSRTDMMTIHIGAAVTF